VVGSTIDTTDRLSLFVEEGREFLSFPIVVGSTIDTTDRLSLFVEGKLDLH
jgi:hypothetical protein